MHIEATSGNAVWTSSTKEHIVLGINNAQDRNDTITIKLTSTQARELAASLLFLAETIETSNLEQ